MDYLKIIAMGIVTTIATLIVKQVKSDFSIVVALSGGILMLIMIASQLTSLIGSVSEIFSRTQIDSALLNNLFKIIAIGYVTEFSASLCADAGCQSIGDKMLFCGKIVILFMTIPIITCLLDIIIGILP